MNWNKLFRHIIDYFLLLLIIGFGVGGVVVFRYEVASQVAVCVIMALLYVFWGVFHHYHDGNLTSKVILEYIGISALATFILVIFLLRV